MKIIKKGPGPNPAPPLPGTVFTDRDGDTWLAIQAGRIVRLDGSCSTSIALADLDWWALCQVHPNAALILEP